ncbi:MAG TPA: CBS domain-containing protein, partial [Thermoanaerobaculia bacterium]
RLLRELDCGVLPVLRRGVVAGMVTDRDLCLTVADLDRRPSEIPVERAMSWTVWSCREEDTVESALATMRYRRIRRLPVLDARGTLCGILTLNDVVRATGPEGGVAAAETLQTLRVVGERPYPRRREDNRDAMGLSEFV